MNFIKKITLLSYISVASTESAMLTPAFPQVQKSFQLSNGELSSLMTLFLVGYLLCQLAFGPLANRFGRLTVMRVGFALNVVGIVMALMGGLTHHYEVLLWSRFLTALGAGVGLSGTFTLIHEWLPEQEAKAALSMAVLSFMLGIGVGIYVGGLVTQYLGWIAVLYVMLAYAAVMLLSTALFQQSAFTPQVIHLAAILRSYGQNIKQLKLVRYAYIFGFGTAVSYLYSAAAPLISVQFLGLNASQYGRWNLVIMLGMLLGSLHGKRLAKHHSMRMILGIGLGVLLFCILGWVLMFGFAWPNVATFFVIALVVYYASGLVFAAASFLAMEGTTDRNGASGMMNFINMGTAAIAMVLFGYLPLHLLTSFVSVLGVGLVLAGLLYCLS